MQEFNRIPKWSLTLSALLFANLCWMSWNFFHHTGRESSGGQFEVKLMRTNDISPWPYLSGNNASAVGIVEARTKRPIFAKWELNRGKKLDIESYFFQGEHVFDIYWTNNRSPVYNVYFHGHGKSVTWWLNAGGSDTFNERISYDTNGDFSRKEVWFEHAWYPVVIQNGKNGAIVGGQWRPISLDTNGTWAIETSIKSVPQ